MKYTIYPHSKWQAVPLKAIIVYILLTLSINLSGILVFLNYKWWISVAFMLIVCLAIVLGYHSHRFILETKVADYSQVNDDTAFFVRLCIGITTFVYVFAIVQGMVTRGVSLNNLLERMIYTSDVYKDENIYNMTITNYLIAFTGIFKTVSICGTVLYWKALKAGRIFGSISVLLIIVYNMAFMGSMKELGDICIFVAISYVIQRNKNKKINKKVLIIIATIAVALFCYMLYTRTLGYEYGLSRIVDKYYYKFNENNIFYKVFGSSIGYSLTLLLSYILQGYYGLSLSLQTQFTFTYGIGNSFALAAYFKNFFGVDLRLFTYPFIAQEKFGYSALEHWSTMFPWIASDCTWVGSIIIIGFVAKLYASLWDECNRLNKVLAPVFFAHLSVMWIYLPCNNQLMQTLQSTVTTVVLFVAYYCSRKKIRIVFGETDVR